MERICIFALNPNKGVEYMKHVQIIQKKKVKRNENN